MREKVLEHFENIAPDYDKYKKNSYYYYSQLKALLKNLIPDHESRHILEIGCGTGSLLFDLNPKRGLGIDISPKMIEIARSRQHDEKFCFETGDAESLKLDEDWEVIILADVLEHLYNPEEAIRNLADGMTKDGVLILTWANSLWEPILHILEKLKMKMPEGVHNWESRDTVVQYLEKHDLTVVNEGTRCLIPASVPLADRINNSIAPLPLFNRLGLIRFIEARKG